MGDRANQQTSIRSYYARRLDLQQRLTDVAILTTGFLLAVATFMDRDIPPRFLNLDAEAFMALVGALGILNFAVALVLLYMRPGPRADNQKAARRHYTNINREVKRVLDLGVDVDAEELERRYLQDDPFLDVPDHLFLIYKARHIRKVAISRLLSDGVPLKEAKRRVDSGKQGDVAAT